ncbi:MAG: AAA domain-containing protein [Desulfurococcales archaeon]|jgi:MoxR-like ATPase|nr:AAA domain-containing protein [Desulfurococcales archaeon]
MRPSETLLRKLFMLRIELNNYMVGREKEIDATLASLISGEPAIFISPPGTGKTKMIELLSNMIEARYFYYLLTKFTEPDELIGPIDIAMLREGKYSRITSGKLPEAEIAFLDEIFRASSAIRNSLLDIILFRRVYSGNGYLRIPLLTLYAASNEVSLESEDAALYDRFTIRDFHGPVGMDQWTELIRKGIALEAFDAGNRPKHLNSEEVRQLQAMVKLRAAEAPENPSLMNKYIEAMAEMKASGIELSDRRKIKTIFVASAISFIYQEGSISLDSLGDAIRLTAPYTEEDLEKVENALLKVGLASYEHRVRQLRTLEAELTNLIERAKAVPAESNIRALNEVVSKSVLILERVGENQRLKSYASQLQEKVEVGKEVLDKLKGESDGNG